MNRRGFLATLAGAALAPLVPDVKPDGVPVMRCRHQSEKGNDLYFLESVADGRVQEYLSFPRALTDAEVGQLTQYMNDKWGRAITL